jgi:hypothetical protein
MTPVETAPGIQAERVKENSIVFKYGIFDTL